MPSKGCERDMILCWEWSALAGNLVTGVAAGTVSAALYAWIQAQRREMRIRSEFAELAGTYSMTRKLGEAPEAERARVTTQGNVLNVVYIDVPRGDSVVGYIAMSEELTGRGEGYYDHVKRGQQLWGFWDVQVKDSSTILVHTTYAHPTDHRTVASAFVWQRIEEESPAAG
jgi:hypothetical protein